VGAADQLPAKARHRFRRRKVIAPLIIAAVIGLLSVLSYAGRDAPLARTPGTIWFGAPYDAVALASPTYELQGVTRTFDAGQSIGMEAYLPQDVSGQDLVIHVECGGIDRVVGGLPVWQAGLLAIFDDIPAALLLGDLGVVSVAIVDSRGDTVASGSFSIASGSS
jgi:hypothetical protein